MVATPPVRSQTLQAPSDTRAPGCSHLYFTRSRPKCPHRWSQWLWATENGDHDIDRRYFCNQGMLTGTVSPPSVNPDPPRKEFLVTGCDDALLRPLFRNTSTYWRMTGLCCQHTTSPMLSGGGGGFGTEDSNVLSNRWWARMVTFIPAWFWQQLESFSKLIVRIQYPSQFSGPHTHRPTNHLTIIISNSNMLLVNNPLKFQPFLELHSCYAKTKFWFSLDFLAKQFLKFTHTHSRAISFNTHTPNQNISITHIPDTSPFHVSPLNHPPFT